MMGSMFTVAIAQTGTAIDELAAETVAGIPQGDAIIA